MWPRPKPKFEPGAIVSLHVGGYVVIKERKWARSNRQRQEWVYKVVELKFSLETGELLYSPPAYMTEYDLKNEILTT